MLEREGRARVRWLAVREDGRLDVEDVERALGEGDVRLVAVGAVNQETGVVQEIDAVAALAHARGARVHVDAAQALGKVGLGYDECDTVAIAAHKMRAPKGIGALVVRRGARIEPVLLGGSQERGIRPGTTDPVAAAGLAVAARHAKTSVSAYARVAALRDEVERGIVAMRAGAGVNGRAARAPHVTNVAFPGWSGPELVAALDLEGVCVSSGSACSAGTTEPSPVLAAMYGKGDARAESSVRVSMGEGTTKGDVEVAVAAFGRVLSRR
jgi:cysteine desulfurase